MTWQKVPLSKHKNRSHINIYNAERVDRIITIWSIKLVASTMLGLYKLIITCAYTFTCASLAPVHSTSPRVPHAQSVDLRPRACLIHKWVITWYRVWLISVRIHIKSHNFTIKKCPVQKRVIKADCQLLLPTM